MFYISLIIWLICFMLSSINRKTSYSSRMSHYECAPNKAHFWQIRRWHCKQIVSWISWCSGQIPNALIFSSSCFFCISFLRLANRSEKFVDTLFDERMLVLLLSGFEKRLLLALCSACITSASNPFDSSAWGSIIDEDDTEIELTIWLSPAVYGTDRNFAKEFCGVSWTSKS